MMPLLAHATTVSPSGSLATAGGSAAHSSEEIGAEFVHAASATPCPKPPAIASPPMVATMTRRAKVFMPDIPPGPPYVSQSHRYRRRLLEVNASSSGG